MNETKCKSEDLIEKDLKSQKGLKKNSMCKGRELSKRINVKLQEHARMEDFVRNLD